MSKLSTRAAVTTAAIAGLVTAAAFGLTAMTPASAASSCEGPFPASSSSAPGATGSAPAMTPFARAAVAGSASAPVVEPSVGSAAGPLPRAVVGADQGSASETPASGTTLVGANAPVLSSGPGTTSPAGTLVNANAPVLSSSGS